MTSPTVGQTWEDTYLTSSEGLWLVRVMKLNEKSVRVEPVDEAGALAGFPWQYRMEMKHFTTGRCALVRDVLTEVPGSGSVDG